ncbi:MAG: glycosyltransferase family 2 protein [Thermoanaerobaculia bacterium]
MTTEGSPLPSPADRPFVSVLMPIREEARHLQRSLGSVLAQDYPADRLEVLVADGMSQDGTRDIVASLAAGRGNVRLLDNPRGIVATGLNAAIAEARGEIFVRVDGHCEIEPDYVRRCVDHLVAGRAEGVGGPLDTVGETRVARAIALAMSSRFGVGGSPFRTLRDQTCLVDTVAFPAYRRDVVERAGPFDEELVRNQDDEYNYRLRKLGARILLAADVRSRYWSRSSLSSLWRQYFQYGFWKVRVMQKHPRQMRPRQFAPPAFAGALLVLVAAAPFLAAARVALGALAGSYAVFLAIACVRLARREPGSLPVVPVALAILHLAYGLGFLTGVARFWNRWGDPSTRAESPAARRIERGRESPLC